MSFRLGLLNPNTDRRHTDAMAAIALRALPGGSDVVGVTAPRGPASIESSIDSAVAAAVVVEMVRELPGLDAFLVSCFGDPGVDAARELTDAPVVGIGEAAYRAACLVARRFAVLTTLGRGVPELEDSLRALGVGERCVGVLPIDVPVAEQGADFPETTEALAAAGRRVVDELGAEAIVLACGGMADVARELQERLTVPVCDGVAVGALLAYALWASGLRTSKTGSYGPPERIPYEGMPGFS
jgi:allantoin racemase